MSYAAREIQDSVPPSRSADCFCCGRRDPSVRLEIPGLIHEPWNYGCKLWRVIDACSTCALLIQATPETDWQYIFLGGCLVLPGGVILPLLAGRWTVGGYVFVALCVVAIGRVVYRRALRRLCSWRMGRIGATDGLSRSALLDAILNNLGFPGEADASDSVKRI
jgi:hypothetical protein